MVQPLLKQGRALFETIKEANRAMPFRQRIAIIDEPLRTGSVKK